MNEQPRPLLEPIRFEPLPQPRPFPWWRLLLLPLGLGLALGAWGMALGLGLAGVCCILVSAATALSGLLALLTHGVGTTVLFWGGGLIKTGIGLLLIGWGIAMLRVGRAVLKGFVGPLLPGKGAGV